MRAFFNGDGTNNMPNRVITGWMKRQNVPIVMITTTKTGIDRKGGQIGVEILPDGTKRPQILELAQVDKNQEQLFFDMGLTEGEARQQYFNTNVAILNFSALSPILKELASIIGEDKVKEIMTPTLIPNTKRTEDGMPFVQLDSALASALLNLDAYFEASQDPRVKGILSKRGITKVLRIVNADESDRTEFFTPVKFSSDFWFQTCTDCYRLNPETWMLEQRGETLPVLDLQGNDADDRYYEDVQNLMAAFGRDASTKELTSLAVKGRIVAQDAVFKGEVEIVNENEDTVDLGSKELVAGLAKQDPSLVEDGRLHFENVRIVISKDSIVTAERLERDVQLASQQQAGTYDQRDVVATREGQEAVATLPAEASTVKTRPSLMEHFESNNRIVVIPADGIFATNRREREFENWVNNQPENVIVVVVVRDDDEEADALRQFGDREDIYISRINAGSNITNLLAVYGALDTFGGFEVDILTNVEEQRQVIEELDKGV